MGFPFVKIAISQLFKKPSTEKYPFVKKEAPDGYRGKIMYHPDKCVNCGMCMRVCSPSAITRTIEKTEEGDKITFEFNMGSCTFCQMCADFCARKAIELTKEYSMVVTDEEDLKVRGTFIKKPPVKPAAPAPKEEAKAATTADGQSKA
jgi:NADH-quinone oxidoreductase subunit I